jgi:hypothetical protein
MALVDRVKNILLTPKTEWEVIERETTPTASLITGYVLPLAAVAALATFIGYCIVGTTLPFVGTYRMSIGWGLGVAVWHVVGAVIGVFVLGLIIDALAPSFGAQKNSAQALKVAVYSYTPAWIAGILNILPALGILAILGAIYGIYLLYLGLPRLMKNPVEKSAGYTAVTVIAAIVIGFVISIIGGLIAAPAMVASGALGSGPVGRTTVDPASPAGKLDDFAKKMEEAGKKMEAAEKAGDPQKQMEAALGALGTAMSGGKAVEPLQLEQIKPFIPETFAGLARTNTRSERAGVSGFMTAKAQGTYGDASGKQVDLEVVDTGGMAGLMGLAGWVGVTGEKEDDNSIERTRKEGTRVVHEEVSKKGGRNKYALVLADRFVVSAQGTGVDINALKAGVNGLDLGKLESTK